MSLSSWSVRVRLHALLLLALVSDSTAGLIRSFVNAANMRVSTATDPTAVKDKAALFWHPPEHLLNLQMKARGIVPEDPKQNIPPDDLLPNPRNAMDPRNIRKNPYLLIRSELFSTPGTQGPRGSDARGFNDGVTSVPNEADPTGGARKAVAPKSAAVSHLTPEIPPYGKQLL